MQYEIKDNGRLLDWFGNLLEKGYSKKMVREYYHEDVKACKLRIKEWDYYLINNKDYAVALTVADNGYMGMLSASLIRFKEKSEKTTSVMTFMPLGKFKMPRSSKEGDVYFKNKRVEVSIKHIERGREIYFSMLEFEKGVNFEARLKLRDEPAESMVICTPFKKKKHFYYNQKIVGFSAEGDVTVGGELIKFSRRNTQAILDWGRGVWTYKNTWYWGAAAGEVDGNKVGFNIGYGFGENEVATENMIFFNGKAHKIEHIRFDIPQTKDGKNDYLKPWIVTSSDGRFEMFFEPILNRKAYISAGIICSDQNQVFGKFSGYMLLDDYTKIEVKNLLGFAEKVYNKW